MDSTAMTVDQARELLDTVAEYQFEVAWCWLWPTGCAVVKQGSADDPLSVRGCPSTVKGHSKILSEPLRRKHLRDPPLERRSLMHPLQPETKG
jgi:hypothetical protein